MLVEQNPKSTKIIYIKISLKKNQIFYWYRAVLMYDMNRVISTCSAFTKLRRGEGIAYQRGTVLQLCNLQQNKVPNR